jgi:hypothetical protein
MSSSTAFCQDLTVTAYGTFTCLTQAIEVTDATTLELKYSSGQVAGETSADVEYKQTSTMTVTAAAISGSNIVLTGTGFPTSGSTAIGSYNGTDATSYTIDSET